MQRPYASPMRSSLSEVNFDRKRVLQLQERRRNQV